MSFHTQLKSIDCHSNLLTNLQFSNWLEHLHAYDNKLKTLFIPWFSDLKFLWLARNELSSIYLMDCPEMIGLDVEDNLLTDLDITENPKLLSLSCAKNPQLNKVCIDLSHIDIVEQFWKTKNPNVTTWSTDCDVVTVAETDALAETATKTLKKILTLQGQEIPESLAIQGVFLYQYSDNSVVRMVK